jgi:hypothetical protein
MPNVDLNELYKKNIEHSNRINNDPAHVSKLLNEFKTNPKKIDEVRDFLNEAIQYNDNINKRIALLEKSKQYYTGILPDEQLATYDDAINALKNKIVTKEKLLSNSQGKILGKIGIALSEFGTGTLEGLPFGKTIKDVLYNYAGLPDNYDNIPSGGFVPEFARGAGEAVGFIGGMGAGKAGLSALSEATNIGSKLGKVGTFLAGETGSSLANIAGKTASTAGEFGGYTAAQKASNMLGDKLAGIKKRENEYSLENFVGDTVSSALSGAVLGGINSTVNTVFPDSKPLAKLAYKMISKMLIDELNNKSPFDDRKLSQKALDYTTDISNLMKRLSMGPL